MSALPLDGLRVADFCWLIAGPATTRVLADFGADVIKIESNMRLDNIRTTGVQPPGPGSIDTNGVFNDTNTGKRSITLDLNTPEGIALAKAIVRHSDFVTNNFTGDRMDRWGLGYEDLRAIRPDIIMLTMPVMGTTGPYIRYGSYGNGVIGYAGMRTNMGFPGRPPVGIAPLYSDFSAPYFAVSALLAALHHRDQTGEGQFIDLSQLESAVSLLGTDILDYTANGRVPEPRGNRALDRAPHGAYPCAGTDRWCVISVHDEVEWRSLCEVMGRPDLVEDPRFASMFARLAEHDALDDAVAAWTRGFDAWEAVRSLQARGVTAGVVEDLEDMVTRDPHLSAFHLEPVTREGGPTFLTHRQPFRIDGVTPALRVSPRMGEHNEEVFRGLLGLSEAEYLRLIADGVIN